MVLDVDRFATEKVDTLTTLQHPLIRATMKEVVMKYHNLEGQTFGRWTVGKQILCFVHPVKYLCRCSCGATRLVRALYLLCGRTKSCGCLRNELSASRWTTHGLTKSSEYGNWCNMKRRCRDKSNLEWHRYGGRGIKVCDRWINSFKNFILDMGKKPTIKHEIDRINNDGNYEPSNCRWVTSIENRQKNSILKLNTEKVLDINTKLNNGKANKELAVEYSVSIATISSVRNKKTWKNVLEVK